jgi:DNA-binding transcriptional MerR regulator
MDLTPVIAVGCAATTGEENSALTRLPFVIQVTFQILAYSRRPRPSARRPRQPPWHEGYRERVTINELAELSEVSAATIKFYVREGVLHEGTRVNATRTRYDETHLARLKLIRTLVRVGGLPMTVVKSIIDAMDSDSGSMDDIFRVAQHELPIAGGEGPEPSAAALARAEELCAEMGWVDAETNPAFGVVMRVLDGFTAMGFDPSAEYLRAYAHAAVSQARADFDELRAPSSREALMELMVAGSVLADPLSAGLHRLAQQQESARFSGGAST